MNNVIAQNDLVILVADKDMEFAMRGILSRQLALGIGGVRTDIFTHPEHDPGCYLRAHEFLRSMAGKYSKALVLFDLDGSGAKGQTRAHVEAEVEDRLEESGWRGRCRAIVLDPELEIWVWSESPHVAEILGWKSPNQSLQQWLIDKCFLHEGDPKPHSPKDAMEAVLRLSQLPRSASRYRQLAENVSLERCTDEAFLKLKTTLKEWFGN